MRYLTTYSGDEISFKFGNTGSIIRLKAIDSYKVTRFDDQSELKVKIKDNNSYIKTIDVSADGKFVNLKSSDLSDLSVGKYDLELWEKKGNTTIIYPDEGFLKLTINQNSTQASGNVVSTVALEDIEKKVAKMTDDAIDRMLNRIQKEDNERLEFTRSQINVASFGAKGDGITDDTESIQRAIDERKNGGSVFFPNGHYRITKALNVYSGVTLHGESQVSTWIIQKENNAHIIGTDVENVTIKDITFEGAGMDSAGGGGLFFGRKNNSNVLGLNIENVTVQHCAGTAITVNCPITSNFTNVRVLGIVGHGFDFYGSGTSVTMNNCYAITCTQAGFNLNQLNYSTLNACATEVCGIGYFLRNNCNNVSLISCGAEDNIPRSDADGVKYPGVDIQIEGGVGNSLVSCYSRNNEYAGILVKGGSVFVASYRHIGKSKFGILTSDNAVIKGINNFVSSNNSGEGLTAIG